jgi:hypothetical protein
MSSQHSDSDQDTNCSDAEMIMENQMEDEEPVDGDVEFDYLYTAGVRYLKYTMIAHAAVAMGLFLSLFWL